MKIIERMMVMHESRKQLILCRQIFPFSPHIIKLMTRNKFFADKCFLFQKSCPSIFIVLKYFKLILEMIHSTHQIAGEQSNQRFKPNFYFTSLP